MKFENFFKKVENFLESNKNETRFALPYNSAKVNIIQFKIIIYFIFILIYLGECVKAEDYG